MFDSFKPGTHFEMDLMDRKAEVKRIIEDVINSMSDDEGEEGSEDEAEDDGKADNLKSEPDGGEEKWFCGLDVDWTSKGHFSWQSPVWRFGSVQFGHRKNEPVTWVLLTWLLTISTAIRI
jgi:hypothetical protein